MAHVDMVIIKFLLPVLYQRDVQQIQKENK